MDAPDGEALHGGAISRGIDRVGDLVRRPAGPWTAAVHDHLERLLGLGVTVPEPAGVDGDDELLSFIDGAALWTPGQPVYLELDAVSDLGRLLRRYHAAAIVIGADEEASWNRLPIEPAAPRDIICHNDFSPWNVIRTTRGLAIIDWDLAAPGTALWDLAYAAWSATPMWNDADVTIRGLDPIRDRAARLRVLLDGYGAGDAVRQDLIGVVVARLEAAIEQARVWAAEDRPGWRSQWDLPAPYGRGGGFRRDIEFIIEHETDWMAEARV